MSNTESTTSVGLTSNLSAKLVQAGSRKTPLALAIAELVGSYLGSSGMIDGKLLEQLRSTRENAADAISKNPSHAHKKAENDENL